MQPPLPEKTVSHLCKFRTHEGPSCFQDKGPFEEPKREMQPTGRAWVTGETSRSPGSSPWEGDPGARGALTKRSTCPRRKPTDGA